MKTFSTYGIKLVQQLHEVFLKLHDDLLTLTARGEKTSSQVDIMYLSAIYILVLGFSATSSTFHMENIVHLIL